MNKSYLNISFVRFPKISFYLRLISLLLIKFIYLFLFIYLLIYNIYKLNIFSYFVLSDIFLEFYIFVTESNFLINE